MHDDDALDAFLREAPLDVPPDFASQVMALVHQQPMPVWGAAPAPRQGWRTWVQWLVLLGSVAAGSLQLAGFVFGIWTAAGAA